MDLIATVALKDTITTPSKQTSAVITADGFDITVKICDREGITPIVGLEIWNGRLRIVVWDDDNDEAPRIIDLEKT